MSDHPIYRINIPMRYKEVIRTSLIEDPLYREKSLWYCIIVIVQTVKQL
jgi:hypothetical protein